MPVINKKCCTCGQVLSLKSFGKNSRSPDNLMNKCKVCMKQYRAIYNEEHKDRVTGYRAKHYQVNKEKIIRRSVKYYRDNKERVAKRSAEYRIANKEEIAKRQAEYQNNNKEKLAEYSLEYRQDNKDQISKQRSEFYFNDKSGAFARAAKHRALRINQTSVDANLKEIQVYYAVCNETNDISGGTFFHVDHIQPLSKGGLHHEDNLQILESRLNLQKNDKWPLLDDEQAKYRGVTL